MFSHEGTSMSPVNGNGQVPKSVWNPQQGCPKTLAVLSKVSLAVECNKEESKSFKKKKSIHQLIIFWPAWSALFAVLSQRMFNFFSYRAFVSISIKHSLCISLVTVSPLFWLQLLGIIPVLLTGAHRPMLGTWQSSPQMHQVFLVVLGSLPPLVMLGKGESLHVRATPDSLIRVKQEVMALT